jgi:phosphoglycolate phosphatase
MEKIILFDLDGTLWDTSICTYQFVKDYLEENNYPYEVSLETVKKNMGNNLSGCAEGYFPQVEKNTREELLLKIFQYEVDRLNDYQSSDIIYENVYEVLKELSKDYKLGIVSNCSTEEYIENFIRISNTKDYITDYIPASKYNLSKGEAMQELIKRNHCDEGIYVGDTKKDQEEAKNANIPFIYAEYGFGKIENPWKIKTIKELPAIVEKLF